MRSGAELREAAERAAELTKGLSADVRGALAAEVFRALVRSESSKPPLLPEQHREDRRPRGVPETTIGEYLAELGPLSHPNRLVAIATFRFLRGGIDGLTSDEFLSGYAEVRIPRPQNLSVNLARCLQRGWLAEGSSKDGAKSWRATQRGIAMIEAMQREKSLVS